MNNTLIYLKRVKDNLLTSLDLLNQTLEECKVNSNESSNDSVKNYYEGRISALEFSINLTQIDISHINIYIKSIEEGE